MGVKKRIPISSQQEERKMRTEFQKNAIIKSFAGDVYSVTDVTEEKVELASVTFDPDDETYHINGEEYITVPAKTVDKFFTVVRPAEPEVPDIQDYAVKDGVLYYNSEDTPIDTGSVKVKAVKGACKGHLMLTVYPRKAEDMEQLADYSPETGTLNMVTGGTFTGFHVIDTDEEARRFIMVFEDRKEIKYEGEDGNILTGEALHRHAVVVAERHGRLVCTSAVTPVVGDDIGECEVFKEAGNTLVVFASNRTYETVETVDGEYVNIVRKELGRNNAALLRVTDKGVSASHIKPFDGFIKEILPCPDGENVVFVTDVGIVHTNVGHTYYRQAVGQKVLDAVKGHKQPLKLEVVSEQKVIFTFGNPDTFDAAVITVEKSTRDDSGFHTEVEYF